MKQCIALAGCACLLAAGCAQSGMMARRQRSATPGYVATSQNAPRPRISRDFRPAPGFNIQKVAYDKDCGCDDCPTCGSADQCQCGDGCSACGAGCDKCGGMCRRMVDGVASGFCGCGPGSGNCCVCPTAQRYPEYPAFNQGPPVGQVAYPYYTVRGPRDFLRDHPPSIGPY